MNENDSPVMGGFMMAAKVGVTALPSAVAADMAVQRFTSLAPWQREAARVAMGAIVSTVALMAGAPAPYAIGPVVGTASTAAVEGGRQLQLSSRLAAYYAPNTNTNNNAAGGNAGAQS